MSQSWDSYQKLWSMVQSMSYKPGWKFNVYKEDFGSRLDIVYDAVDADHPDRTTKVCGSQFLADGFPDNDAFMADFLMHTIKAAEDHESREFFKINGQRPFPAHEGQS